MILHLDPLIEKYDVLECHIPRLGGWVDYMTIKTEEEARLSLKMVRKEWYGSNPVQPYRIKTADGYITKDRYSFRDQDGNDHPINADTDGTAIGACVILLNGDNPVCGCLYKQGKQFMAFARHGKVYTLESV